MGRAFRCCIVNPPLQGSYLHSQSSRYTTNVLLWYQYQLPCVASLVSASGVATTTTSPAALAAR